MPEKKVTLQDLIKINDYCYEIPQSFRDDMRVPARIFMTQDMFEDIKEDRSLVQLVNTATLPGIVECAYAMPDIHQGYGFPIGGVVGTAIAQGGVISPGGIGYDINCGIRLLVSNEPVSAVKKRIEQVADELFTTIPSGAGHGGSIKLDAHEIEKVLTNGAEYMVEHGYGRSEDLIFCEEEGRMPGARADLVSDKAKKRGGDQLGTLGSGNHFLEVQEVEEIFDESVAQVLGIQKDSVLVMIHCGSRGLGHQVCTDYVRILNESVAKFNYVLPDRELVCAPFTSQEGQDYFAAMAAAANFAWANRHAIGHFTRLAWKKVFGESADLNTIYDISHNIGKREMHEVNGKMVELLMHRKGATRSFGPGRQEIPEKYRSFGQPVLIPGTMGTASYVLIGTHESMKKSLGSCCHGAGRTMSRMQAKKMVQGKQLKEQLMQQGITIRCDSNVGLAEEAPIAYKDVDVVVNVVHNAGLARKVAKLKPLAVIKGG